MPKLVLFGRKWSIASDDFVYRGLLSILHRCLWVFALVAYKVELSAEDSCFTSLERCNFYTSASLVLFVSLIIMNIGIALLSATGSIIYPGPRLHLPKLLYAVIVFIACDLGLHIYGAHVVFNTPACSSTDTHLIYLKVQVIYFLVLYAIKLFVLVPLLYVPNKVKVPSDLNSLRVVMNDQIYAWRIRLNIIFGCCVGGDPKAMEALNKVAVILSKIFGDVDFALSDIAAGMILLYEKRSDLFYRSSSSQGNTPADTPVAPDHASLCAPPSPWMTLDAALYFSKYVVGAYGWPMYLLMNAWCGLGKLLPYLRCRCLSTLDKIVEGDNFCFCHTAALRKVTCLKMEDILYASFIDDVYEIPFFVAVDHDKCVVVVCIRGTQSLTDVITDVVAGASDITYCEFSEQFNVDADPVVNEPGVKSPKLPPTFAAHGGMAESAHIILLRLEQRKVLDRALEKYPGYNIIITGHSLGAGTAAILGLLLKSKYPLLRCILYSPPGGLLDRTAALETERFQMSVVIGSDAVPRLSLSTVEDLKNRISTTLEECPLPKYWVIADGLWRLVLRYCAPKRLLHTLGKIHLATVMRSISIERANPAQFLFLPGKILHVVRKHKHGSRIEIEYAAYWRQPEFFSSILVAPRMLRDHMPKGIVRSLDWLVEKNWAIPSGSQLSVEQPSSSHCDECLPTYTVPSALSAKVKKV